MTIPPRPLPFVLSATEHGTMIVNHLDYREVDGAGRFGVGCHLLSRAMFDPEEVALAVRLLRLLREVRGDGVVALDCGANVGVHTLTWARNMTGWGKVVAIEAQERIFYALAGNICLNNCFNARAIHAAVGDCSTTLHVPVLDYCKPASFGSLELKPLEHTEDIGQTVDYRPDALLPIRQMTIDEMALPRVDFIKLDVEGMETAALAGARETIARCRPVMLIEHVKSDTAALEQMLNDCNYNRIYMFMNTLAVPADDPVAERINFTQAN